MICETKRENVFEFRRYIIQLFPVTFTIVHEFNWIVIKSPRSLKVSVLRLMTSGIVGSSSGLLDTNETKHPTFRHSDPRVDLLPEGFTGCYQAVTQSHLSNQWCQTLLKLTGEGLEGGDLFFCLESGENVNHVNEGINVLLWVWR